MQRSVDVLLIPLIFISICVGAVLRFYKIQEIGMIGDDDFFYWETARQWALGNYVLTDHYRPFAYFIFGISERLIGVNDWSIKLLNSTLEVLNILLIYLISNKVLKSAFFGLLTCMLYAWVPFAFEQTSREAIHVISATFFLLTVYTYFSAVYGLKVDKAKVFISGLLLGLTANTHPDLGVLGITFVFFLIYRINKLYGCRINKLKQSLLGAAFFSFGFVIPFLTIVMIYGGDEFLSSFVATAGRQSGGGLSFFEKIQILSFNFIVFSTSKFFFFSLIAMIAFYLFHCKRDNQPRHEILYFFGLSFINYVLVYTLLVSKHMIYRLYFPMISLPLIVFVFILQHRRINRPLSLIVVLITIFSFWGFNPLKHHFFPLNRNVSPYKTLSETLKNRELKGNILVLPLITYASRKALTYKVYLEGRGVYMSGLMEKSITDAVQKNDVEYIWFSDKTVWTKKLFDRNFFKRSYNYLYDQKFTGYYNPNDELELLKKYMETRSHKVISNQNGLLIELL